MILNHLQNPHVQLRFEVYLPSFSPIFQRNAQQIPSGELTFCHGTSPFFMGKSTISMAIFNCYVTNYQRVYPMIIPLNHHFPMVFLWFSYGFPMLVHQRVSPLSPLARPNKKPPPGRWTCFAPCWPPASRRSC